MQKQQSPFSGKRKLPYPLRVLVMPIVVLLFPVAWAKGFCEIVRMEKEG